MWPAVGEAGGFLPGGPQACRGASVLPRTSELQVCTSCCPSLYRGARRPQGATSTSQVTLWALGVLRGLSPDGPF